MAINNFIKDKEGMWYSFRNRQKNMSYKFEEREKLLSQKAKVLFLFILTAPEQIKRRFEIITIHWMTIRKIKASTIKQDLDIQWINTWGMVMHELSTSIIEEDLSNISITIFRYNVRIFFMLCYITCLL